MAIETNQRLLEIGKIYKVDSLGDSQIERDISASIWVNSGSVDIYASDSATQPDSLSKMTLNIDDAGVIGKRKIEALPNYIVIMQNTGTTTEIVMSGVEAWDRGFI